LATLLFPLFTFIMSTYDGSLGALLLVSLLTVYLHFKFERNRRVLSARHY
jgi:hypothetical protein